MEKVTDLIGKLAEKLGTTVVHLWGVMTAGAQVEGLYYLGWSTISFTLLCICVRCFFSANKIYGNETWTWDLEEQSKANTLKVFAFIGMLTFMLMFASNSYWAMLGLLSPEYFALKTVKDLF